MTDIKEEVKLFELVYRFNPKIASLYLESTLYKMNKMDQSIKINNYVRIPIPGIVDCVCFRIRFRSPLFFLISPQISLFRTLIKYYKSDIGFLPAYVPEINEITIIKTWNYFADSLLGPTATFPSDYTCLKISKDKEMAELSSMNFILRNDSDWEQEHNSEITNLVTKYFEFFYWNIPKPLQIMRNILFYHDYYKILSTYHIVKTIFIIEDVKKPESINMGYKFLKMNRASVKMLINSSSRYEFKEIECFITEEMTRDIIKREGFGTNAIINALLTTIKIGNMEHKILSGLVNIIQNPEDLIKTITGIIASERFGLLGDLSIGMGKEFEKDVFRIFEKVMISVDGSTNTNFGVTFDKCISYFSPLLIFHGDNIVYYLHPSILGMLAHLNRIDLLKKPDLLVDLINILRYSRQNARFSKEADNLQKAGIHKLHLLNYVHVINDSVIYSRILKK